MTELRCRKCGQVGHSYCGVLTGYAPTEFVYDRLAQHLLQLEAQLRSNDAHSCRHCHYYACDGGVGRRLENDVGRTFIKCRCHCGTVRDTIEAEIEQLKAIILPLAEGAEDGADIHQVSRRSDQS